MQRIGLPVTCLCSYLLVISRLVEASPLGVSNQGVTLDFEPRTETAEDVAKQLTDPIADMVSIPVQWDWSQKTGMNGQGHAQTLTVQPVLPFNLPDSDQLIFRPIITAEFQSSVNGFSGYGFRNIQLETFYSPDIDSSWTWGVGPYLAAPAGTSGMFGSQQTGGGLNAVLLNQTDAWTYGALVYRSWSLGGNPVSGTQNVLYYNPFISYVTPDAWTYGISSESVFSYDVRRTQNPIIISVSKLVMTGSMPISYEIDARYNATSIPGSPQGWGARASLTFVLTH